MGKENPQGNAESKSGKGAISRRLSRFKSALGFGEPGITIIGSPEASGYSHPDQEFNKGYVKFLGEGLEEARRKIREEGKNPQE